MRNFYNLIICLFVCGVSLTACASPQSGQAPVIEIAESFFDALAAEDEAAALSMLTEDAMLSAPFNPNGDARDEAIRIFPATLYVKGAMATYDNLVFVDRVFSVADSGKTLWIEAEGRLRVAATGKPYENRYVFKLTLDDGKISSITEYVNVANLAQHGVPAQVQ